MVNLIRRRVLLTAGTVAMTSAGRLAGAESTPFDPSPALGYPYAVPPLMYGYDANEASIDAQTMKLHHDLHHGVYVNNLNAALKDHPAAAGLKLHELLARIQTLPEDIRTVVRNNAGGHANHTMFWQILGGPGGEPGGDLAAAITRDFGAFAELKTKFNKAAMGVFGSGWAMVKVDTQGKLALEARPNQDTPLLEGTRVLFGNDVWEHAYYLRYQNRRADYLAAWWNVLDWSRIATRYDAAKAGTLFV